MDNVRCGVPFPACDRAPLCYDLHVRAFAPQSKGRTCGGFGRCQPPGLYSPVAFSICGKENPHRAASKMRAQVPRNGIGNLLIHRVDPGKKQQWGLRERGRAAGPGVVTSRRRYCRSPTGRGRSQKAALHIAKPHRRRCRWGCALQSARRTIIDSYYEKEGPRWP